MSIITRIKRLINGSHKIQVWDTSAISNHFNGFVKTVEDGKVEVVVPEGVVHELSDGRHTKVLCKRAYEYIMKNDNKIRVEVTPSKARSWTVDEQVVCIACDFTKKGYDTVLVTSDRDEEYKAKLRKVETKYLPVVYPSSHEKKEKVFKKEILEETEKYDFNLPCITRGKNHFVTIQHGFEVLDSKGKRKIGRENLIIVGEDDKVKINDVKYKVAAAHDNYIGLRKI